MKIAIMQPYFLPYIGYFQLINMVDKFVVYDDVNFINKGWVNRNNILVNSKASLFTVPLQEASQNKLIKDIDVLCDSKWINKFLKSIEFSYRKSPNFNQVYPIITGLFENFNGSISTLAYESIIRVMRYLKIDTVMVESSTVYGNSNLKSQDRILDICLKENADHYINPIGGIDLYNRNKFQINGIKIDFIRTDNIKYTQNSSEFVPSLSIIDVLMYNSHEEIHKLLGKYTLV